MYFSYPGALALAAGATIPVILHLLARGRPRPLVFPGVYLLQRMEAQRRALRLRHLLLLALRISAVVLAALACAGALVPRALPLLGLPAQQVVLLDASASMAQTPGAWEAAVEAAGHARQQPAARGGTLIVAGAPSAERGQGERGRAIPPRPTGHGAALAEEAVRAAADARGVGHRVQLVVFTDLDASSLRRRRWPPAPLDAPVTIVDCAGKGSGRRVYGVRLLPPDPPAGERATVIAQLEGRGDVMVKLTGPGARGAAQAADGQRTAALAWRPPGPTRQRLEVVAEGPAEPYYYVAPIRPALAVYVAATGARRRYLSMALDPVGRGQPLRLVPSPAQAAVVVATDDASLSAGLRSHLAQASLVLFATGGGDIAQWLAAVLKSSDVGLTAHSPSPLPPARAERLKLAPDAWAPLAEGLDEFALGLASRAVLHPVAFKADERWRVLARFSDGAPAVALRPTTRGHVLVLGFAPDEQATDLVASGLFPALLHFLLPRLAPPARPAPPALPLDSPAWASVAHNAPASTGFASLAEGLALGVNPPPAELAARRSSPEGITRQWGPHTKVVGLQQSRRQALPRPQESDLTPLLALLCLAALGAETLLAAASSAPADDDEEASEEGRRKTLGTRG